MVTSAGTTYTFGLNKLPGAPADTETNSVWTVPVYGDDEDEPGYKKGSSFSGRSVRQAWRWNLDLVQDLRGNASTYWYAKEANYYAKNGVKTALTDYTRGGYLKEIKYGQRSDALFSGIASGRVAFTYEERCDSDCSALNEDSADNWPDVPFDTICASTATDCKSMGPSFFARKRLVNITTQVWSTAAEPDAYTDVDGYALDSAYGPPVDINDPSDRTMVLKSITRTGKNGTDLKLDPVDFTYDNRPNPVKGVLKDVLPINRPRMRTITSETGATTEIRDGYGHEKRRVQAWSGRRHSCAAVVDLAKIAGSAQADAERGGSAVVLPAPAHRRVPHELQPCRPAQGRPARPRPR
ncbi:hypothetical protein [Streptomyces sp. NPDC002104]